MKDTGLPEVKETQDDPGEGPGAILRRARKAKGLDVAAVAAMLHLSEFKVQALEADDFDSLPEPVFVRGYLKNYARLLEEPSAPVLDAYSQFSYEPNFREQPIIESSPRIKVKITSNHALIKGISIVVVVALIAFPLIWWWDNLELAAEKLVGSGEPQIVDPKPTPIIETKEIEITGSETTEPAEITEQPASTDTEISGETPVVEESNGRIKATIELKPATEPVVSVIKELEPAKTETKPISIPQPSAGAEETKPEAESKPEPEKVVAAVTQPTAPKSKEEAPAVEGVVFNFVDSGWVKVRDFKNRVILIGEHKKGAKKKLRSKMPYKVVLGNSNAVKVEIDGKVVDIDKFSSGGVARFTINKGKIEKP